jgi:hypothetical protein
MNGGSPSHRGTRLAAQRKDIPNGILDMAGMYLNGHFTLNAPDQLADHDDVIGGTPEGDAGVFRARRAAGDGAVGRLAPVAQRKE